MSFMPLEPEKPVQPNYPPLAIGQEFMLKLAEILGMEDAPIKRMIMDFQLDEMVHIYTDQYIEDCRLDKILELLAHLKPKTPKTQMVKTKVNMRTPEQPPLGAPPTTMQRQCSNCGSKNVRSIKSSTGILQIFQCADCDHIN